MSHETQFADGCRKCGSPSLERVTTRGMPATVIQYKCEDCGHINTAIDIRREAVKKTKASVIKKRREFECE
jgi:uncharacterized Zn finger protein